jgi:hypothetical protein
MRVASSTGVAWPGIQRVVAAVVRGRNNLIVAAVARTLNETLTSEQVSSLRRGGRLYLPARKMAWSTRFPT